MSTPRSDRPGNGPVPDTTGNGSNDPDAIRADIEATREQLGRTVDELSGRLDVPARAREQVARTKDTAVETYRESPPAVIGAGAALSGLVGLVLWRRRRKRRRATPEGALGESLRVERRRAQRARKDAAARRVAARKARKRAVRRAETKARRAARRKR